AADDGWLGGHLDLGLRAVALVDDFTGDDAVAADREREGDRALGAELDAVGDQFGDDQLQVLEDVRREDLVEYLERRASLGGRVFGGWELEAELHGGGAVSLRVALRMRHPRSGVGRSNGD